LVENLNYTENMKLSGGHSGRTLTRNTFLNFVGRAVPMVVGFFAIPLLIKGLGTERFGILTLIWLVIGYFGIFDMGVGRANTKFTAEYLALNEREELGHLIWTSLFLMFSCGIIAGISVYLLTPILVGRILNVPPTLIIETRQAFYLMATGIPLMLITAGSRGVLEAQQRFSLINGIQMPAGIITFISPLLVLHFSNNLVPIIMIILAIRFLVCLTFLYYCIRSLPELNWPRKPKLSYAKKVLRFGGWLTVCNIIGPIIVNLDRFFIGSLLTMEAVAYYVTPYQVASQLWIIPQSLAPVVFPAFSAYSVGQQDKVISLLQKGVKYVFLLLAPITVVVIVLANPFLSLWIGTDFARISTPILQLLAVAVLINSIGQIPYSAIEGMNRPDLIAKLHLLEFPIFLGLLWFCILKLGLIGAALVWLFRAIVTTFVVFWIARRLVPSRKPSGLKIKARFIIGTTLLIIGLYFSAMTPSLSTKIAFLTAIIIGLGVLSWLYILDDSEKEKLYLIKSNTLGLFMDLIKLFG